MTCINQLAIVQKVCVLKVDTEYPKESRELHSDYLLAPDKIEIKEEMLFDYQLKIARLYKIPNFFDKEKYVLYYENLQLYLKVQSCKLKKHW